MARLITNALTTSATFLTSLPPPSPRYPSCQLINLSHGVAIETLMSVECVLLVLTLTTIMSGLRETTRMVAFVANLFDVM
jgi:hydroquinone glucosyltransferase